MTEFVRISTENGMEATVSKVYADTIEGVKVLDGVNPLDSRGKPLAATRAGGRPVKPRTSVAREAELKGAALNKALTDANLSTSGTKAEKQARLAEAQAAGEATVPAIGTDPGDDSGESEGNAE
jgi:hypothetical protein